jgi:hypothetical protein
MFGSVQGDGHGAGPSFSQPKVFTPVRTYVEAASRAGFNGGASSSDSEVKRHPYVKGLFIVC